MITIFKNTESGLVQLDEPANGSWIRVQDPESREINGLVELGIPQDFISSALDEDERSRTERDDNGAILIVLRVPLFMGAKEDVPYTTVPLGVILTDKYILTVSRGASAILDDFASGRLKGFSTGKRNRFVLRILFSVAARYLMFLREIDKTVEAVEDRLQRSMRNKEVLDLLKYQKSLVYFATALKANEIVLERLQRSQLFKMYPDDEDLLEDVITENQQAIEMVNISGSILNTMMDAFSSIISNNLNVMLKFLTSVTIILSIPAIVTSFFGIDAALSFQDHPLGFVFVIVIFLAIAATVVWVVMRKDWF
jgi:magnesium transporter